MKFCAYRREDTYKNDNYVSDGLSTSECLAKAKELIEAATKEAKKACVLQRTISVSLNNLFALPEFEPLYEKFAMFNYIRIRTEDEILKLRIIGIEFSGDSAEEIQVTFSEQIESIDGTMSDLQSIIQQAGNMATSYSSTVLQAKQGSEAQSTISDIYTNGLNAAKTMLTNNDNNEITITPSGIICRRMDDEGFYGNKQIRITGNIMAFTRDNWESVETAIGEVTFKDPESKKFETRYGIVADAVVGNLIVGNNMFIGNQNGSVQITGSGIKITNGTITWGNGENSVNAPEMDDIDGLNTSLSNINTNINNFKTDVKAVLGLGSTTITSSTVIAPKIGGGYLFITDGRTINNTGISVEINPSGTGFTGHNGNYVFNISKKNNDNTTDLIMGVTNGGNGYFSGEIQTESGKIGGWDITKNTIQSKYVTLKSDDNHRSMWFTSNDSELSISPYGISHRFLDDNGYPTFRTGISKDDKGKKYSYINGNLYSSYMLFGQTNNGFHDYFIKLDFDEDSTHIDSDLFVNGYIEASGLTEVSDERVKNSLKDLKEFDNIFMELEPIAFKYNEENGKQHFGYGANHVKQSFLNNGYSLDDFSGIVKLNPANSNSLYKNIDEPMGLKYTEFIPWNTHMIQKLYKRLEKQQEEINWLKREVKGLR